MTLTVSIRAVALACLGCLPGLVKAHADIEVDRLKSSYEAAVNHAAREVTTEIDRLKDKPAADASGKTTRALSVVKDMEQYFVDKIWQTPPGTKYHFFADGSGFRQFGGTDKLFFKWRMRGGRYVEIEGPTKQGGTDKMSCVRFVSETEGYMGDTSDRLEIPLKPAK